MIRKIVMANIKLIKILEIKLSREEQIKVQN